MRPLGQALIRSLRRTGGAEDTRPARPTDPIQGTRPVDPRVRPAERAPRPSSSQWIQVQYTSGVAPAAISATKAAEPATTVPSMKSPSTRPRLVAQGPHTVSLTPA